MKFRALLALGLVAVGIGLLLCFTRGTGDMEKVVTKHGVRSSVESGDVAAQSPVASATQAPAASHQLPTVRGTLPYVVTATQPIDKPLRLALQSMGARTVAHLDANRVVVEATREAVTRLKADARFTAVDERLPESKIEETLAAKIANGATTVDATIVALSAADLDIVLAQVKGGGGELLTGCLTGDDTLTASLPATLVADLAARGDVQWLESFERPRFFNNVAVDATTMNVRSYWKSDTNPAGLSGDGQVVTTSDTGIDTGDIATMHEDLRNRVVGIKVVDGCYTFDKNGHGTHTAGSIAGDGTKSDGKIRGTAWGAKLYAWFCGGKDGYVYTPNKASDLFRPDQANYPAYIHSASWGSAVNGAYTSQCKKIDEDIWNHPDFLPVFAAGNEGSGAMTVSSPGSAKNVLTVGATQNARKGYDGGWGNGSPTVTATFSSRGPCADGRIKPEVAAPGVGVLSTRSHGVSYSYGVYNEYYAYDSGTSMATPLTAGAMALIREWLVKRDGFSEAEGKRPTAALMKAVVMGGATDAPTPNNNQGWGRVNIGETLNPSDRAIKLIDRIPFAATSNFVWVVETTNTAPLSVQLCWIDYPGSSGSSKALVNDLDLTVHSVPGGSLKTWYGNGDTTADRKNNSESVRIADAEPTKYIISVDCHNIAYDYTDGGAAALYVSGAFDPEATPTAPGIVRNRDTEQGYLSLDTALDEVRDGETIEVLQPVELQKSISVSVACTITATNDNPFASLVTFAKDTKLTVAENGTLTLKNIAFAQAAATSVFVQSNGLLRVGGIVDFNAPDGVTAVSLAKAGGVRIFEPLTTGFSLTCDGAMGMGDFFGTAEGMTLEAASEAANLIVNAADTYGELRGSVLEEGGEMKLVWKDAPVPLADAAGYFIGADGSTNTTARLDRLLEKFELSAPGLNQAQLFIRKSGTLTRALTFNKKASIIGEKNTAGEWPTLEMAGSDGFVFSNCTFTVKNINFTTHTGSPIVDAQKDAVGEVLNCQFTDITGATKFGVSGAILVRNAAKVEVKDCLFDNCRTEKTSVSCLGGAIMVMTGASLALFDSTITNCYASSIGGGVYAQRGSSVTIGGNLKVRGNESGKYKLSNGFQDNIHLANTNVTLYIARELTGGDDAIGLNFYRGNNADVIFASLSDTLDSGEVANSAKSIVNDVEASLEAKDYDEGKHLAWSTIVIDREVAKSEAVADVRLTGEGDGIHHYFATLTDAFDKLDGKGGTLTLLAQCSLVNGVTLSNDVTITSAEGGPFTMNRGNEQSITVMKGATLKLTDVIVGSLVDTTTKTISDAFIRANGGTIDLCNGATLRNIIGNASRAAGAIAVWNDGLLLLRSGSEINGCGNTFKNDADGTGYGAVTIDKGTVELLGGVITGGSSYVYGGGLFAGNGAVVKVAKSTSVYGSLDTSANPCNLTVADGSSLQLANALDDKIGVTRAFGAPTDVFGTVTADLEYATLTNSAAHFVNDESKAYGIAVTNSQSDVTLLVWSTAIKADGSVVLTVDNTQATYWCVGDIPQQQPKALPLPIAFSTIATPDSADTYTVTITAAVAKCWYSLYETNSLVGGFSIEGVKPVERKQAVEDGEIKFTRPRTKESLFWRVVADPEE